jgi:hypothetical protein
MGTTAMIQPDVRDQLRRKLGHGRALMSAVRRTLALMYGHAFPRLDFLATSQDLPASVRGNAVIQLRQLRTQIAQLQIVQWNLMLWRADLQVALACASQPDGFDLGQQAMVQMHAPWLVAAHWTVSEGTEVSNGIEQFLVANQRYLAAPAHHVLPAPAAVNSHNYSSGYYAGWDTQARFFQHGTPVERNLNRRRFTFADNSYVDIQAHEPGSAYSSLSDLAVVGTYLITGAAVAVAVAGIATFAVLPGVAIGMAAAVAGSSGGAGSVLAHLITRPYNAAWQGYTARYYNHANAAHSWGVRHFYGWKKVSDLSERLAINGSTDVSTFENFANAPDDYDWWRWREGSADHRAAVFDSSQLAPLERGEPMLVNSVDQLAQALAAFAPAGSSALAGGQAGMTANGGATQQWLLASRT